MLKAVIFDMDGVLVDSEKFICRAAIAMFEEKGFDVAADDFKPFVGTGENRYLGGVAQKHGIPFDLEQDKMRTYAIYDEIIRGALKPLAGVQEFIRECRARKLKTAVASSADKVKVEANLREMKLGEDAFDTLVNGLDVEHRKPNPEIFLLAAKRIGVAPEACLVIEDAVTGVQAAKAAGMKCLGLTTSFTAEELDADWTAPDLAHAPEAVLDW